MKRNDVVRIASAGRSHHAERGIIMQVQKWSPDLERYEVAHEDGTSGNYVERELVMVENERKVEHDYPIGASVLIAPSNVVAVVDGYRHGGVVVRYPNGNTLAFPDPYGALSVVYLLTKEELLTIDDGIPVATESDAAQEIVNRHLRPTVERVFTVRMTMPAGRIVTTETVRELLTTNHYTGHPVVVEDGAAL